MTMAASAYSAPSRDSAIAQINITPLVDVMLVLLVIFMISTPALTRTMSVRLPGVDGQRSTVPPPKVELRVDAAGGFALDGRMLSRDGLAAELAALAQRSPQAIVEIATSRDADYQAFATALATARTSGVENIIFPR
jgi:biopolymer transport protein ExbD/biopolymer transport protein TolR